MVSPGGSNLWRWRFHCDQKEKLIALGEYPIVTLAEAPERLLAARKVLAAGVDPMAERKAELEAKQVERALSLLTENRKLVFPGALDKEKPMSNNTILFALYRLGYKDRMTGHGIRGLASTILHENGFEYEHVELQFAHQKRNKVAAAYHHAKYLKQRASMMQ